MKNIKLLAIVLLLSSTSAKAENFLQADNVNDPQYIGGDESDIAQDLTEGMASSAIQQNVAPRQQPIVNNNEYMGDMLPGQATLASKDINVQRFYLKDSEPQLTEKVSEQLDEKNLSISNLKFKRDGGSRSFDLNQVKNVVIKSKFTIESINVDEEDSTFTAMLKPQTGSYKIEATGTYSENQKVPVLSRNIGKGEKITQDDIELKATDKALIVAQDITDVNNIIGKTATRGLSRGKMITNEDIRNPITIAKNSTVSAIFRSENIEIKTLAVALEDGSDGDIIRMKNFDSGKVFKAVVQEDGSALIGTNKVDITASLPDNFEENNFN